MKTLGTIVMAAAMALSLTTAARADNGFWFEAIGNALLTDAKSLLPLWTTLYYVPVVPLFNYNNTVVLGSLVGWVVLFVPIFFVARLGVAWYRTQVLPRLLNTRIFKFIRASKLYNFYQLFQTD